uniref:Uncharacterized protein n=1 Tax=Leersia perrieri TaxID=77586 RepID=A0A0D9Y040_9ORYZ
MSAVEAATFAIVLCPLFLVYMFGLYISAGLSLWRLKQHDYGNTNGDATKANLKPALDLLYSLALAQGVLFGYRFICYSWKRDFAKDVVSEYLFDELAATSVYKYVHDTRIGCEKNPSFAKERNFITYAVDLLQSEGSPENYLNGIRIMDTLIGAPRRKGIVLSKQFKCIDCKWYSFSWEDVQSFIQQNIMIRGLLIHSSSSSHILHKLLLSLDSTSPYDTEIRGRAARIVAHLADGIHLEQFPRGIHCIASLLNTCEEQPLLEPFERDWLLRTFGKSKIHESAHLFILPPSDLEEDCIKKKNKREKEDGDSELVTQGLRILKKLAANEENCRIISNTQGLLSKIMAPVTSDLLHQFDHGAWSDVVRESLRVMRQLVNATGETGTMLLEIISGNKEAMATVERILRCDFCKNSYPQLHKQAIRILIEMDASSTMSTGCRESIVKTLVGIFIDEGNVSGLRQFAGEKLATLCLQSRTSAKIVLQAHDDVIGNLTNILGQVKSKSSIPAAKYTGNFFFFGELADRGNKYRISASNRIHNNHRIIAAQVLEGICIHHSNDNDECLKEVMVDVMHKITKSVNSQCNPWRLKL